MTVTFPLEELLAHSERLRLKSRGVIVAHLFFEETDQPWGKYRFEPLAKWQKLGAATDVFSRSPGRSLETGL